MNNNNGNINTSSTNSGNQNSSASGTNSMSHSVALNGQWQLVMTPELGTAGLQDASKNNSTGSPAGAGNISGNTNRSAGMNGSANTSGSTAGTNLNSGSGTTGSNMGAAGSAGTSGSTNMSGSTNAASNSTANSQGMNASGNMNGNNNNSASGNNYRMPRLNLHIDNGTFTGYTGCNSIMGHFSATSGNSIKFNNPNPSTAMACSGGFDEAAFLDRLRRVDSYAIVADQLQLKQGNQVLLSFSRTTNTGNNNLQP
jgi:heat shock protein HslJ